MIGKKITVKATAGGKTVESAATDTVVKGLVKAEFAVDYAKVGQPSVGDVIKVNVTPAGAASAVTYQWYRNDSAIVGETKDSYTTTANDAGSVVYVIVTPAKDSGFDTTAITLGPVRPMTNVSTLGITLAANDATAVPTSDTAYVIKGTRTDATKEISGTWSAVAYRDSYTGDATKDVKATGQIFNKAAYTFAVGTKTATFTYTPNAADIGHKIVIVVKNDEYAGTLQFTMDSAKTNVGAVAIASDSEVSTTKNLYPGKTVLTASLENTDATATYQWYTGSAATGWTAISGATSATYTVPSSLSSETGSRTYKVVATGTGNYTGSSNAIYTGTIDATTPITVTGVSIEGADHGNAVAGTKLTAVVAPAAAASSFDYTWYVYDVKTKTSSALNTTSSSTYTVSDQIAVGNYVYVVAKNTTDKKTYTNASDLESDDITIGTALKSVTATYDNGVTAGAVGYASFTAPTIGQYVNLAPTPAAAAGHVTYDLYMDSYVKSDPTRNLVDQDVNSKFDVPATVTVNDESVSTLGHKFIVVATGTGSYVGTVQFETPAVAAVIQNIKSVDVYRGSTKLVASSYGARVGTTYAAEAMNDAATPAEITSGVKYVWSVGGSQVASDAVPAQTTQTDAQYELLKAAYATCMYYTPKAADAGKTITVTATSSDSKLTTGTATWNNFGVAVMPKAWVATVSNGTTEVLSASGSSEAKFYVGNVINLSVPQGFTDVTYTWNGVVASGSSYTIPAIGQYTSNFTVTVNGKFNSRTLETITLTFTYHPISSTTGVTTPYFTVAETITE